ncbi:MAG: MFS transporter [Burkholderiales bacterium]|nr:MFS transporter [Burkholderiales bacterium]
MSAPPLARRLATHLPFHYGWIVLGCVCLAGFARQGPSLAVLAIFVDPMGRDLGWSSTAFGGAVSLGGVIASLVAPALGRLLDRHGARFVLLFAVIGTGISLVAIASVHAAALFYLFFCFARMNWAGPFDLGLYGALNAWFVARRALAASIATLAQLGGLAVLPLLAHLAIAGWGWRAGWIAVGLTVLAVGLPPVWLLLARRPEDLGLAPETAAAGPASVEREPRYTRGQAMRMPAFWLIALYTVLLFPCQAGVSLYQAAHMIERGIDAGTAAAVVGAFSGASAVASFTVGWLPRRWPIRVALAGCSALVLAGTLVMLAISHPAHAFAGGALFGAGVGAMLTMLPVVWADYFGRASYGAIRGAALSMQVFAQACGPLAAGMLRDAHGSYVPSLTLFAALAGIGTLVVLGARRPGARAAVAK